MPNMPLANESIDFICSKHRTDTNKGQYEQEMPASPMTGENFTQSFCAVLKSNMTIFGGA